MKTIKLKNMKKLFFLFFIFVVPMMRALEEPQIYKFSKRTTVIAAVAVSSLLGLYLIQNKAFMAWLKRIIKHGPQNLRLNKPEVSPEKVVEKEGLSFWETIFGVKRSSGLADTEDSLDQQYEKL